MSSPLSLYELPRRQRDPATLVFSSLGIVIWSMAASSWVATQQLAYTFGYQPALGVPFVGRIYAPFQVFAWAMRFDHPSRFGTSVHRAFVHAYFAMTAGTMLGIVVASVIATYRLRLLQRHNDLHGSAHWACAREVHATGLTDRRSGVYVGAWRNPHSKRTHYLRDDSATHCLAFMPTGSGKTVGLVIPTLLSWPHSAVVHDLKGEIWAKTAGWRTASVDRGGLAQSVFKFEPTAADGSSVQLNPLDRIRRGTQYEVQDVQNIVELVADEGEKPARGDNRFWVEMAKRLLLGLTLHVIYDEDPTNDSLPGLAATLADPRYDDIDQLFEHLRGYQHDLTGRWRDSQGLPTATHPLVAQIATQMLAMEPRVKANIVAEAQGFLTLYSDPIIAANISKSDFDLGALRDQHITLYLVVQPAHKKRLRPLTRLVLTQILLALMESHVSHPPVLIMLEEMAELGALDVVATALALGRGYGLKLFLIAQDLSQLQTAWGSKSTSLVANCAIRIASAPNDLATAELLSKMCGAMTVRHEVRTYSGSRLSAFLPHTVAAEHDTQRPLLAPDEVMRLPGARKNNVGEIVSPGTLLVFVAGHAPIYGVQPLYFADPTFARRATFLAPETRRA